MKRVRSSLPGVEQYYITSRHSDFVGVTSFNELLKATLDPDYSPVFEENAAAIYYTSGTTGLPKSVRSLFAEEV